MWKRFRIFKFFEKLVFQLADNKREVEGLFADDVDLFRCEPNHGAALHQVNRVVQQNAADSIQHEIKLRSRMVMEVRIRVRSFFADMGKAYMERDVAADGEFAF